MKNKNEFINDNPFSKNINRRNFLKWSGAVSSIMAVSGMNYKSLAKVDKSKAIKDIEKLGEKIIRTGCPSHNCGGRCLLKLTVKNGLITKIEGDDRVGDDVSDPQLRPCIRGRAYRRRQYHPDRLKYPLKRVGKRGEGKFKRISWEEALNTVAGELKRVKKEYGNSAILVPYGTGSYSNTNGSHVARRLMNKFGGSLGFYNSYSWACISKATPYVYGTNVVGNQRQDWLNSKYIIMWGWNPSEMRDGTNSDFILKKAKERGAKIICIDPRMSMSAVSLADDWIAIRPGTDTALMSAMAYVMITEGLYDKRFVKKYCSGFDKSQMPDGAEEAESYKDHIFGIRDGIPKTPQWAEKITSIPYKKIIEIARDYAKIKPAVLYQGYGMQRRAYGEQCVRGGAVLAAITGNIGIPGGWASGLALQADDGGPFWTVFPSGKNPVKSRIPVFSWTEAVVRGKEMGPEDGVKGTSSLDNNIKLIYSVASNVIANQHGNLNRTAKILKDHKLVEFIIVQDNFLTPSAKFADIVLPACTQFESWGVEDGWKYGDEVLLMPRIVDPPFETKSDYQICRELAQKLNIEKDFTEDRNEKDWVEWILNRYRKTRFPAVPDLKKFESSNTGVYSVPVTKPKIGLKKFVDDPVKNPLNTPTGKIEIFSKQLYDMKRPDEIPAVPKYIQEWESPFGLEVDKFPLQAMGHHYAPRVHSTHDNNDWLNEAFPQKVFINPVDAEKRGISDSDTVKIFNDRGIIKMSCRISSRILPGVIDIPQGGWWTPDKDGVDTRGSVNVLSSERATPLAFGNAQHTIMVEVVKV